jgi:hypothetical protein
MRGRRGAAPSATTGGRVGSSKLSPPTPKATPNPPQPPHRTAPPHSRAREAPGTRREASSLHPRSHSALNPQPRSRPAPRHLHAGSKGRSPSSYNGRAGGIIQTLAANAKGKPQPQHPPTDEPTNTPNARSAQEPAAKRPSRSQCRSTLSQDPPHQNPRDQNHLPPQTAATRQLGPLGADLHQLQLPVHLSCR